MLPVDAKGLCGWLEIHALDEFDVAAAVVGLNELSGEQYDKYEASDYQQIEVGRN